MLGCLVCAALFPAAALAQVARVEMHTVNSVTLTDQQFLTGNREGTPVTLAGELRLPRLGAERLPAVILMHGSAGVTGRIDAWAHWLNDLGLATFLLDFFTGRGLVNLSADQGRLGRLNPIVDSYRALELLSRHGRVDPQRIAIIGFSRGGNAALYASVKRFERMHLVPGLRFAAYISFYPSCNVTYIDGDDVAEQPIRIFHGAMDDFAPPAPCRPYVARLQKAGRNIHHTEYPGAHHAFDSPAIKTPVTFPQSQTSRRCVIEEIEVGRIINSVTKQPFTYQDPCVERGPTLGYNEAAYQESLKSVRELVTSVLKPN